MTKKRIDHERKVFLDKLRVDVTNISDAVATLNDSLNTEALVVLIQANCHRRVSKDVIEMVLEGMESLESYVFAADRK